MKILPATLAADPQFRERFDREARAISQLTHPHICTLFDVGEQQGTAFLVMEYLEGETLADRLMNGPLPLDDAFKVAIQIADALSAAHRHGIVHRDLKPGNVMLTVAGAKLLDFGLAKASGPTIGGAGQSRLPTTPANLTARGTILGTFQYMAPEQLEGKEADARTDIFAFGAVLYEMLTGKRAFSGASHASLIASIMSSQPPPVSLVQMLAPAELDLTLGTILRLREEPGIAPFPVAQCRGAKQRNRRGVEPLQSDLTARSVWAPSPVTSEHRLWRRGGIPRRGPSPDCGEGADQSPGPAV